MTKQIDIKLRKASVLGSGMAYREAGAQNAPVALFLHGNPTSSHIWRNIMPLVSPVAHCLAPDNIGFGQSGKPNIAYRFFDHVRYLDAFIEQRGITSAYLVAQDWARRSHFILRRAGRISCAALPSWNSFVRCRPGRTSTTPRLPQSRSMPRRRGRPSVNSGRRARARR
ncbi:alpha/beta fold hydrolase [Bradyrhizobium sp. 188]|uniref:alpha/beta fold hydrolase n=1 Tax=Bradyrhizobium sp. 188 TaxID=2782656 RepID=UPI001FFA7D9A|nr:alpha/beta fold hydrolase [Bradyrhizobium sp. 188]